MFLLQVVNFSLDVQYRYLPIVENVNYSTIPAHPLGILLISFSYLWS